MRTKKLDPKLTIEQQIEFVRLSKGWTKQRLSDESKTTRPTIDKAIKDHRLVTPRCLGKIMDALGIKAKVHYEVIR